MPTFDTPRPISVTLDLVVGGARIIASDRTDTVVEIHPHNPSSEMDVRDAEQTRVEYADGRLLIRAPKRFTLLGKGSSVDVTVQVPAGSDVHSTAAMGDVHATGRLGACTLKRSMGDIRLDETSTVHLTTPMGDITADRVSGTADITTGSGAVRVRQIDGAAVIKNSNGDTWIGEANGGLRVNAGNGDISVDRASAAVEARTAHGGIRIREVIRDSVTLETAVGSVEVGVREGSAAWLDVSSGFGRVSTSLEAADGPQTSVETVEVRARTSYGDITVHRS